MQNTKKAFSFVELIVVLAILALLAIIGVNMYNSVDDKTNNSKVITGAKTLNNALSSYKQEKGELPFPDGNRNYFKIDSSYAHSGTSDIFGVYGSVTETTLPKKYLDNLPLDPVSNHYYAYGKTMDNEFFEIASVLRKDGEAKTKLEGTYPGENGPVSLIREYNGPYFVSDGNAQHLPYNPDEHILTAKLISKGDNITVNEISVGSGSTKLLKTGDKIVLDAGNYAQLYFADGSISLLGDDSEETEIILADMDFKDPKDNLLTKVKLYLSVGSIFTQATALNDDGEGSDFEIYTQDTTAAVRGTEFLIKYDNSANQTQVAVIKGIVEVKETTNSESNLNPIEEGDTNTIEVQEGESVSSESKEGCEIDSTDGSEILISAIKFNDYKDEFIGKVGDVIPISCPPFMSCEKPKETDTCLSTTIQKFTPFKLIKEEIKETKQDVSIKIPVPKENIPDLLDKEKDELNGIIKIGDETYKLYAKAELNNNLEMITSEGFEISKDFNSLRDCDFGDKVYEGETRIENICKSGDIKGVSIDNTNTSDYLKYTDLDSGNNFIIEMSVLGSDLVRTDGNYFLFQTNSAENNKLQLNEGHKTLSGNNPNHISISSYSGSINENQFYKVQYICEDGEQTIIVPGTDVNSSTGSCYSFDTISIGSKYSDSDTPSGQWNGLIDYVKIYKRED